MFAKVAYGLSEHRQPLFLSAEEFWARFGRAESGTLEFKEGLIKAAKLQEPVVAFANAHGGRIVLGIGDGTDRPVLGVVWDQVAEERIQEAARITHPPIALVPEPVQVDGRTVIVIDVATVERGWVQTSDGRLLVRAGPTNRTLVGDELARFVRERSTEPVEDAPVAGTVADLLDEAVFGAFLQRRLGKRAVDLARSGRELGFLAPDGRVRLAALLLFGREPQARNRRFGIDVVRYEGRLGERTAIRDRRQLSGRLDELVAEADRLIYEEMRRDAAIRGLIREEVPEFPPVAIREALVNAVGHRDYALRGSAVEVRLYDDGLEIESPGALAGWVTVENLRDAQYSRNVRVMDALALLGLVEEAGTGIDRMIEALDDALLVPPRFEEREASFVVRLSGQTVFSADDRVWVARFADRVPSGHGRVALVYARRHGAIRNEELRRLRGIDAQESRRVLSDLVNRGLLVQIGTRGGTRYVLGEVAQSKTVSAGEETQIAAIVAHAQRAGSVANRDVRGLLGVDAARARELLELAVARGHLAPHGERRARRYLPPSGGGT